MMIRRIIIIALGCFTSLVWADDEVNESQSLYGFLQGPYELIGRFPDSDKTYSGQVVLKESGNHLEVIRNIQDKETRGAGTIETATADKIKVLRVRFVEENKNYEATYLIGSDLDNYGRLTGYLYLKDGGTKVPGLEALFFDKKVLEKETLPDKTIKPTRFPSQLEDNVNPPKE